MQVTKLEPNHICCNPNCHKGPYGQVKHYYACDYCNRIQSWRSKYCCLECFLEAKSLDNKEVVKPHRTDMTEAQYDELMTKPVEEVKEKTLNDLSEYSEYMEENGLDKTIDFINEQIDLGDWDE